nr:MAG TPA: DNA ligase [Caudoviricetes sp.]
MEQEIAKKIATIAKKDILNIRGLNMGTARNIVDFMRKRNESLLREKGHFIIFEMSVSMLQSALAIEEKDAEKLHDAIHASRKNVTLPVFLKALCLNKVGADFGKYLGREYGNIYKMCEALDPEMNTEEDINKERNILLDIEGFGQNKINIVTSKVFWDTANELSYYIIPLEWEEETKKLAS